VSVHESNDVASPGHSSSPHLAELSGPEKSIQHEVNAAPPQFANAKAFITFHSQMPELPSDHSPGKRLRRFLPAAVFTDDRLQSLIR
jgi:hypothetical protein